MLPVDEMKPDDSQRLEPGRHARRAERAEIDVGTFAWKPDGARIPAAAFFGARDFRDPLLRPNRAEIAPKRLNIVVDLRTSLLRLRGGAAVGARFIAIDRRSSSPGRGCIGSRDGSGRRPREASPWPRASGTRSATSTRWPDRERFRPAPVARLNRLRYRTKSAPGQKKTRFLLLK